MDPAEGPESEITLANTFPLATATLQTVREETISDGVPRLAQELTRMTPQAKAQALSSMAREMTAYARTATEQAQATLIQPTSHPAPANRRRRAPSPTMSEASTAPTLADVDGPEMVGIVGVSEALAAQRRQAMMQAAQNAPQMARVFTAMEERYRAILNAHTDWNHEQVIAEMLSQCNGADEIFQVNQFSQWKLALQQ